MAVDFQLSASSSIGLLIVLWIYYFAMLGLFLYRRNTFPIKQRLPWVVVGELLLFAAGGTKSLLQSAAITAPDSPLIIDCRIHVVYMFIFEYIPILVFAYRVTWIILKDFNTQRLFDQCKSQRNTINVIPPYVPQTKYQKIMTSILKRIGVFQLCSLVIAPGVIIGIAEIIAQSVDPVTQGVNFYSLECFYNGYKPANAVKIAVLLPLLLFLSPNFLRLNDDIKLGTEVRAILVVLFFYLAWIIAVGTPSGYQALFIDSKISLFVVGVLFNPLEMSIQGLYPLYLSIRQERLAKRRKGSRSEIDGISSANLDQDLIMSTSSAFDDPKKGLLANSDQDIVPQSGTTLREALLHTLESTEGRDLFLKYSQKEFAIENLMFYEACVLFSKRFSSPEFSQEDALTQAREICDTFVKFGAVDQVNLSHNARLGVLNVVSSPEPKITSKMFEKAQSEIFTLMARDSFARFKMTKEYKDFLKEKL
jgi:hypothetical protein